MRLSSALLAALVAAAVALPAPAAACKKPRQLKVLWDAKGEGQIVGIAYGCSVPPTCPTKEGKAATSMPITVAVRAGTEKVFDATLQPCDDERECQTVSSGACPGGVDAHKAANGMVKFAYNTRGTASVMARVRGPVLKREEIAGPVTLTVTDGAGYAVEATYTRCRSRLRENTNTVVCR